MAHFYDIKTCEIIKTGIIHIKGRVNGGDAEDLRDNP